MNIDYLEDAAKDVALADKAKQLVDGLNECLEQLAEHGLCSRIEAVDGTQITKGKIMPLSAIYIEVWRPL